MLNSIDALLTLHEGVKLKPYRCTAGKLTIGIGRNLDDVGISEEESIYLMNNDISKCELQLESSFPWFNDLNEVRQTVLVDMCFNLGIKGLLRFINTLDCIKNGDYIQAAKNMTNSKWALQVKARASRLAKMMETGEWPTS